MSISRQISQFFDIEKYDKAEARVIAVSQQSARLEICGVELTLPMNELFWSWVADVREHLSPGDVIPVKILDESVDEEGNIKLRVSGKEAVKNTAALALKKIHPGNKMCGSCYTYRRKSASVYPFGKWSKTPLHTIQE